MPAADVLERLSACGVRLVRDGDALVAIPKQALNDELRALIRAHKAELLMALPASPEARRERAMAYLEEHPLVKRACFADVSSDPDNVILTVVVRDPSSVAEVAVSKDRFDAFALMDLAAGYPDTALSIPEH